MQATITEALPANAQINNVVLRRNLRAKMVQNIPVTAIIHHIIGPFEHLFKRSLRYVNSWLLQYFLICNCDTLTILLTKI